MLTYEKALIPQNKINKKSANTSTDFITTFGDF
jgi:hypothetical protein